ncbi:MAG: hypothetical protein K2Y39_25580 [Candidatus Obscuribacterales bacterium]|nr:hypothetical protein [Candidatus Obscuribacterales bacterium]
MTDKESPLADIYTLLGVSQMSPMEGVRTRYYKLTRAIHRELLTSPDIDRRNKLLYDLKFICIAYDILSDPVTRTDYDLRTMGLRGVSMVQTPEEKKPGELGQRLHLKIGELLNVAGLLEGSELEIACDMHKAMPEMQFGSFLVKQGFIEEYQLEAVLFAQKLLRKGLITVVQYQAAMEELESSGVSIAETAVERGYVTQSDLDHLEEVEAEAEAELNRPVTTPVYTQPPLQPKIDEQVTSHSNLLAQMLPPGSSDVVSARASGNGERSAGILGKLLSGTQDGDITAPPGGMGNLLKAGGAAASGAQASAAPQAPVEQPGAPQGKEHKESKKKRNIELHEVAQAFDPDLNRGANQDVASDTYEGAAYKDELLKADEQRDTGELGDKVQQIADRSFDTGPELLTADDIDDGYNEVISKGELDTASSDQLGFMDAESSGVEFQGFVDSDDQSDDEDEDEDEEEEDEGNITLIDSEAAAIFEASLPAAEAEKDAQSSSGRDKTTDSTHERIPAYAFSDRALHNLDEAAPEPPPAKDIGQESGDMIESKKSQSTTRDKIPAFRPPLHNTFQLDEANQSSEAKQEEGESGDRQLVISNAVPSWKDNLEWTAPDAEQAAQQPTTASQESEVVDISRHIDLEAIEPQNKGANDDELKSFLGEEYREDLNELGESGRPLWDVEDDEFIVPSSQKRGGHLHSQLSQSEEEERQAREKRTSGGWQRLKNPFELQLDTAQSGQGTQTTGEEAIVEPPREESLEGSRSETADFIRPSIPGITDTTEQATVSSDAADSFVESEDNLESSPADDSYRAPLKASSNPSIVIGLDESETNSPSPEEQGSDEKVMPVEPVYEVEAASEEMQAAEENQPADIPVFEAAEASLQEQEGALAGSDDNSSVGITSMETHAYEELAEEVREPEVPVQDEVLEEAAPLEASADEKTATENAENEDSGNEDSTKTSDEESAAAAPTADVEADTEQATEANSDNGNAEKDREADDTAGDDNTGASASADAESALSKRRRMLGRRHHRGKP